jgi:chemotaxis protein MotA
MKQTTAIGIVGAIVLMMVAVIMEGGNPMAFINIPAFLIVIGGSSGAILASMSFPMFMRMPKLVIYAMKGGSSPDLKAAIKRMIALAEKARRDGLLALEDDLPEIEDDFTKRGLQLVVDGVESDLVIAILQSESDGMAQRHASNAKAFVTAGGFAPTLGILGTVMSLVHVLENLADPSGLGHAIAGAFIATLYGVGIANLFFLPVSNRLKELSAEEQHYRSMLLEAILSIQAGDNPRMLAEKLETFLPPSLRGEDAEETAPADAAAAQAAQAAA